MGNIHLSLSKEVFFSLTSVCLEGDTSLYSGLFVSQSATASKTVTSEDASSTAHVQNMKAVSIGKIISHIQFMASLWSEKLHECGFSSGFSGRKNILAQTFCSEHVSKVQRQDE